jgi:hypothetical protein
VVFEAKKRFGLSVLPNGDLEQIHLLIKDTGPDVIAQSLQKSLFQQPEAKCLALSCNPPYELT